MKTDDIATLGNEYLMNNSTRTATIVRGKGCRVFNPGRIQYMDFTSGISVHNVGHSHPKVVEAIKAQAEQLIHCSNLFHTPNQAMLAQRLSKLGLGGKVFFGNSGAEANEAMIKLARLYGSPTGRYEIITMVNSFHGRTMATLTATGQSKIQKGFDPLLAGFEYAEFNNLASVEALINENTIGIMFECLQAEGGVVNADPEFVKGIRRLCDEKDLVMMCDEVQCGMARTGKFFGWEHYDVQPDLCTLAKSLADGVPLGALLANPKFSDVFTPGTHNSTFGGGPLACAAALAVLDVIEEEGLVEKAARIGAIFAEGLQQFVEQYDQVLEVRGRGMLLGLAIEGEAKTIVDELRDAGLLVCSAGDHVVRFLPPLIATEKDIEEAIDIISDTFEVLFGEESEEDEDEDDE